MAKAKKTNASTSTAKGAKSTKSAGSGAQFEAGVAKLMTLAVQMQQQVRGMGLTSLTPGERTHTMGKLRDGEVEAMGNVLDVVDDNPALFSALAGKDGGTNPDVVETAPARAMLARSQDMSPVVSALQGLLTLVSDDVIASANSAKELTVPAYAIARASASADAKLKAELAPALTFYGAATRLRTERSKRAANKLAKAAKKSKTAAGT
jgi:hypothetical protein